MTEAPTQQERYLCATNSKRLLVVERRETDVDLLIAAGWAGSPLAADLYRLIARFDEARGDVRHAQVAHDATLAASKVASRRGAKQKSEGLKVRAEDEAKIARAFIMLKLGGLAETKEAFGQYVFRLAAQRRFMELGAPPADLAALKVWRERLRARARILFALSGRMLEVLIDPNCPSCGGRQSTGGSYEGTHRSICVQCTNSPGRRGTEDIGIRRPNTYAVFKHGNCVGCLKAGWQHWYIVYVTRQDIWLKAKWAEEKIGYAIHHDDNGPVFLEDMEEKFATMQAAGVPATEQAPHQRWWADARKVVKIHQEQERALACDECSFS